MLSWLSKIRLWEIGLCVCLGFVCYFIVATTQTERAASIQVEAVLTHADNTLTALDTTANSLTTTSKQMTASLAETSRAIVDLSNQLNTVLSKIMAPCTPVKEHIYAVDEDKPCGTLADLARTLHTIRGFAGTLEFAGKHLDKSLTTYDEQEAEISKNTNGVLSNLSSTIDFAHFLMSSHQSLLDNLQRLAGNSADTMGNVKDITADIRVQTKKFNEPKTKTQKVLGWAPPMVKVGITVTCALLGPC